MFLHSKTIRYRLNKVEQLLDIDLANPLQLLNYEIATYIIKMRRRALKTIKHSLMAQQLLSTPLRLNQRTMSSIYTVAG